MKKNILTAAVLAGLLSLSVVSANAASVSYSATVNGVAAGAHLDLNQFDTNLGTLTGVKLIVNFSTLQGSCDISNVNASSIDVTGFNNTVSIAAVTSGLHYSTQYGTVYNVATTPDWNTTPVGVADLVTFNIASGQNLLTNSQTSISSSYFGAYKGTGHITLNVVDANAISITGNTLKVDSSNTSASTKMTVEYTYDAIPEPTTFALCVGGIGMLVIGQRIRRRIS